MSNEDMKPKRFLKWHNARQLVAKIQQTLQSGGTVDICTAMRVTRCNKSKYAEMFKATRSGAYMQSGKSWVRIDLCAIRFYA